MLFGPASGRQYATPARDFADVAEGMVFTAENGTYVVRDGAEPSSDPLERGVAADVVRALRWLVADGVDVAAVGCGET